MTDYVNKINNIPIGGNIFDGLPTFVDTTLSSGVDLGPSETFTSNLSSILPNDGQDYMCMFEVQSNNLSGVSSTNGYYEVTIHNSTTGDLNNNIWRVVTAGRYHNHGIGRVNSVWLPIFANNKNVTLMQRSNGTDRGARISSFKLKQYYRLGSNEDSGNYIDNITTLEHNLPMGNDTISGNNFVILRNAAANGLNSVTVSGKCEQTATPSPTNPIPIVSNNGQLKLGSHGKNLFDKDGSPYSTGVYISSATVGQSTYSTTTNANYNVYRIEIKPNTTYTFGLIKANDPRWVVTDGSVILDTGSNGGGGAGTYKTITTGATAKYLFLSVAIAGSYKCADILQVEEGSEHTEYEEFHYILVTDGVTETITDSANNTATAEMLLSIGNYTDTQEILSGAVTRKVGVIVLNGTENWSTDTYGGYRRFYFTNSIGQYENITPVICSHYVSKIDNRQTPNSIFLPTTGRLTIYIDSSQSIDTVANWNSWLASQYNAGTPVIIVYPLATETTETVTGQTLTTTQGNNTLTISQASIANLPIEANYDKLGDGSINIPVGGEILAAKEATLDFYPEAAFAFTGSEYKTYDLSQQIPSDGYAYELLVQAYTRSNQNAYCRVYIGWVGADGNYKTAYLQNCGTDSNGSMAGQNNQRVILQPNSRVIRFGNNSGSATGSCRLQVVSYKRLGTNE